MGLKKKEERNIAYEYVIQWVVYSKTDMIFFLNFVLNTYRVKVFMLGGKRHHFNQSTIRN